MRVSTLYYYAVPLALFAVPGTFASPVGLETRQTTWSPPSNLVTALDQVWKHETETYTPNFKNFGYDQLIANNGTLNFCVRWDSAGTTTAAERANVEVALKRSVGKWAKWLVGFDKCASFVH
jgi:hypothetical protein